MAESRKRNFIDLNSKVVADREGFKIFLEIPIYRHSV
nr:MAG TPA: hypothetical protein [Caudoviricetes sp.]